MGFHDVLFPDTISYGSSGGPGYKTEIIETDSGGEQRVAKWEQARHQYDASTGLKKPEDLAELLAFYHGRQGAANSFRWKDWSDYSTAADNISAPSDTDQSIGIGDGTETNFQLKKTYTSGSIDRVRNITLPVAGTIIVAIDGSPVDSADFSVDTSTGILTFNTAPLLDEVITAGFYFHVPCRFGKEIDDVFNITLENWEAGRINAIPIVEVLDHTPVADEFYYGGAYRHASLTGTHTLSPYKARVQSFRTNGSTKAVVLPDPANYPGGGPLNYIRNVDPSQNITIEYPVSTVLATLTPGDIAQLLIGKTAGGANEWLVIP